MKTLYFLFLFSCTIASCLEEKPFVIIIPSHNNAEWVRQNLNSLFDQNYRNYRVIYVMDAPTDHTQLVVENFIKEKQREEQVLILKNNKKKGPLACLAQAAYLCDKEEIIVDLDGNDWLAHNDVLTHLNQFYSNDDVWATYGQYVRYPYYIPGSASAINPKIIEENSYRSSLFGCIAPLRTFYAGLFHEIHKEDLLWKNEFISKAGDLAYMFPLLEMAGNHVKFIPEVLYVYNNSHPINEHKASDAHEENMDRYTRSLKKYQLLSTRPTDENNPESILSVLDLISDPLHPGMHDYRLIQEYLSNGERKNLERLRDMESRIRNAKIIGNTPDTFPKKGTLHINCTPEEKENCLMLYCSFNHNFPNSLIRLLKLVKESDFKGDILYQIGGWPNTEGGSLAVADKPYAFKVSFFKEAERLGYQRALWLDTAVVPLVSLNKIFDQIRKEGYFVMGNSHMIAPYVNPQAAAFFGLSHEETKRVPSCSAGLFGVDFNNKTAKRAIDWWYRAARDRDAFFSARSDQNALSMILYLSGMTNLCDLGLMPHSRNEIQSDSLFWLDREFAHGL